MTAKEMDQMDREVMTLVNERDKELAQEIATPPVATRNDNGDEGEQIQQPCNDTSSVTAGAVPPSPQGEGFVQPCNDRVGKVDLEKRMLEKDGMYCIPKEDFHAIEAAAKRHNKTKNAVGMAVCVVLMGALFLTFSRPGLLPWLVCLGVISCSVVIGVCLERLVEVNR